jgi:uncharacterized protein (TIGR02271 family)
MRIRSATTPAVCCESHANKEVSVTQYEERTDRFTALEDRFAGYEVYDPAGEKIGKVDDLFLDETDSPEYIGVKMGFLGMSSTLIPWEAVSSTDDKGRAITVAIDKDKAKDGPAFDDDKEITAEFENEVYSYYGLQQSDTAEDRGSYGSYYSYENTDVGTVGPGMTMGDTETGEFREHAAYDEGVHQSRGDDLADEDELRVQRTEEELVAGTREREAGQLKVRKRVRTDREHIEVPTRHEEVSVERVPVEGEASKAEIGEDEVVVPVTEEEVVVSKRPVAKEEVRVRKDVVSDTETVEEDVRREEIEVEDETSTRRGL